MDKSIKNSNNYLYLGGHTPLTPLTPVKTQTQIGGVKFYHFRCIPCGALRRFDYIGHTYDRFNRKFDVYICADCGEQITFLVEGKR